MGRKIRYRHSRASLQVRHAYVYLLCVVSLIKQVLFVTRVIGGERERGREREGGGRGL